MQFDRDIIINIADGFAVGYIPFVDSIKGLWSGWKTAPFKIAAFTDFILQIKRNPTENFSEIADVDEFVSAITFDTYIHAKINALGDEINSIEPGYYHPQIITENNETIWPLKYGYGNLNGTSLVWIDSKNYLTTDPSVPIAVEPGDVIVLKDTLYRYFVVVTYDEGQNWESLSSTRMTDLPIVQKGKIIITIRKNVTAYLEKDKINKFSDIIAINKHSLILNNTNNLRNGLILSTYGIQTFQPYTSFHHYGLHDTEYNVGIKYRVSSIVPIKFDMDIKVHVKDGFKWGYIPFENGEAGNWSNWKITDVIISANTEFIIQIARVDENYSEIADVDEFTSALTFNTIIKDEIEILSNKAYTFENNIKRINNLDYDLMNGVEWELGYYALAGKTNSDIMIRINDYITISQMNKINIWCDTGYRYFYILYDENRNTIEAIPFSSSKREINAVAKNASYMSITLRRNSDGEMDISEGEVVHVTINSPLFNSLANINTSSLSDRISVVENIFRYDRYFSHIGVSGSTNIIIPSQSIADVMRTKRLGFKVLEINVHKTSDNHYVCLHGSSGKFGDQFIGTDGSNVSDIAITSVTLDWIKENVRYKSKYKKYQTSPYSLEEILYEMKKLNIIPLVQYSDNTMIDILNQIMGANNYILNLYAGDRDDKTDATCTSWTSIANINEAVAKCQTCGKTYYLGVNHSNAAFNDFTDSDWINYINTIHEAGYYVMGAYMNLQAAVKFFGMGWDALASTAQINEIETGNLCNLFSDNDFSDFNTTGIIENGVLTIDNDDKISPSVTLDSVFLGGGSLHIRFDGLIHIKIGKIDDSLESDGSGDVWVSSYFEEQSPTFSIETDSNGAIIYELSYKASRL